jgi:hypothetical protein
MAQLHLCGTCKVEFGSEPAYLGHTCKTGFMPSQIEHQDALTGGMASRVSEAALKRGEARKGK